MANACLYLLTCLLTVSTFVHLSEGASITYTAGTGIIVLAAAGSYLRTSVLAIGVSLRFHGPPIINVRPGADGRHTTVVVSILPQALVL
jgi:hypothetical protein